MKKNVNVLSPLAWFILSVSTPFAGELQAQDCSKSFYQMKKNASVTLQNYDSNHEPTGKSVRTYKKVTADGDEVKAEVEVRQSDEKGVATATYTYAISCKNGVMLLNLGNISQASGDTPNMEMKVQDDAVELPSQLSVGQRLKDGTIHAQSTIGDEKVESSYAVKDHKVEGTETLETPAGKFETYKVSYIMEPKMFSYRGADGSHRMDEEETPENLAVFKAAAMKIVTWYAKGPGEVKRAFYLNGKLMSYSVLTAYSE